MRNLFKLLILITIFILLLLYGCRGTKTLTQYSDTIVRDTVYITVRDTVKIQNESVEYQLLPSNDSMIFSNARELQNTFNSSNYKVSSF